MPGEAGASASRFIDFCWLNCVAEKPGQDGGAHIFCCPYLRQEFVNCIRTGRSVNLHIIPS